jgi:serine/threonine-protein kinase
VSLAAGTRLGPYEVLAAIGAGGMGEVYRARDTRLGRDVAIKVLPAAFAADPDRLRRFEQEARAIAALNHPNICQIHDIGPGYLVLEFVEGEPLHGPTAVDEAVRLARQMASALEAAHQRNILHRDLKPANILITREGTAKLLDFGVAKLMGAAEGGPEDVTRTIAGTVVGTAAYMSPEQAEGQPLDVRSDIFSFGAVLYELLSGTRAFAGQTTAQVVSAVLRDEPPALGVPPLVERIVRRCLAKRPPDRFQTMRDLTAALEETSSKPVDRQPSIAVLPFENMSPDKENEYFSDGLAEEIINALTRIPGLRVIARTSAFAFKGKHEDIRRIAEALGVSTVLEGSVRKSGSRIRVTAQFITAADGSHLWSERYDRELADVFAIQDEIATAIMGALQVTLAGASMPPRRHTPSLPAYEAYLKARHCQWQMTLDALDRARRYYEEAITLDPGFALARSGHADYYVFLAGIGRQPAREAMPLARAEAQKALELDPALPEAHGILGAVAALFDYDWKEAQRRYDLAMARDPVPPLVRVWYGYMYLARISRWREAAEQQRRAIREDPLNVSFRVTLALSLQTGGEYVDAATELHQVLDLDQSFFPACVHLSANYEARGMHADALAYAERAYALAPWYKEGIGVLGGLLARAGDRSRAEDLAEALRPGQAYGAPRAIAMFHLLCSEIDASADWIEKALEQRDVLVMETITAFPFAKALRSSSRWPKLARMMNLPAGPAGTESPAL